MRRAVLYLFIIIALVKAPFDYYFGIHHQILTIVQVGCILSFLASSKITYRGLDLASLAFFSVLGVITGLTYGDAALQVTTAFTIAVILIFVPRAVARLPRKELLRFSGAVSILFICTTLVSVVQLTNTHLSIIYNNFGGNIVSSNGYGVLRVTGGTGGTVIDYAAYIVVHSLFLTFTWKWQRFRVLQILCIGVATYSCFSRAVFLAGAVGFLIWLLLKYKSRFWVISLALTPIALLLGTTVLNFFVQQNSQIAGTSDLFRVQQWALAIGKISGLDWLFGVQFGRNIGLSTSGTKEIGDGAALSILYDTGLIGLALVGSIVWRHLALAAADTNKFIVAVVMLGILAVVNSGLLKVFVVMITAASFGVAMGLQRLQVASIRWSGREV